MAPDEKESNEEIAADILKEMGVSTENYKEEKTIHQLSQQGNLEELKKLVEERGIKCIYDTDDKGYYGIHWASLGGHVEVMRYYASLGMSLSQPTKNDAQYQPIHWAASRGHVHVIEYLMENGIEIDQPDGMGVTPLICTAQFNQPLSLAWLINKGANYHACDKQGDNALHWSAYKGNFDCFIILIRLDLDPTQLDGYQQNCLHLAVLGHNLTLIDKCLEMGCSLSQKDKVGSTPMMLAEGRQYYDVIRWFQEYLPRHQQPFLLRTGIKPGPTKNAHVAFLLLFCNLFFFAYPMYFLRLLPETPEFVTVHFVLVLSQVMLWFCYFMCRTITPGYVPVQDEEYEQTMNRILKFGLKFEGPYGPFNRITNPFQELCHSCKAVRPPRSKHCRVCRKCVLLFDHHCPYIYTCIGYKNRPYFATFIFCGGLTCLIGVYMAYQRWDLVSGPLMWAGLIDLLLSSFAVTLLVFQTVKSMVTNLTVNESVNWTKYDYLKLPNDKFINPFNRGLIRNLLEYYHFASPSELQFSKRSVLNKVRCENV